MKEDIAKIWVAALRDPSAKQHTGSLRDKGEGRCCLGKLCDLAPSAIGRWVGRSFECSDGDGNAATLPGGVRQWAGLQTGSGDIDIDGPYIGDGYSELCSANDGGVTFAEIADFIEANWRRL